MSFEAAWWRVGVEPLVVAAPMLVLDLVLVLVVLDGHAASMVVLKLLAEMRLC